MDSQPAAPSPTFAERDLFPFFSDRVVIREFLARRKVPAVAKTLDGTLHISPDGTILSINTVSASPPVAAYQAGTGLLLGFVQSGFDAHTPAALRILAWMLAEIDGTHANHAPPLIERCRTDDGERVIYLRGVPVPTGIPIHIAGPLALAAYRVATQHPHSHHQPTAPL